MDHRFTRRLLGVAVAILAGVSLFASTPALSSEHQARNNSPTVIPKSLDSYDNQPTAAVVLPPGAQPIQPQSEPLEKAAPLNTAPAGASAGPEAAGLENGQEEEEDEADTEATPDLVLSEEVPNLTLPGSEIVSIPELDLNDFDVPIELNERVKAYILYYQTRKWGVMSRAFERSGRYLPMMRRIFREQGLPQDLVNLAYVESAFNPRAYSKARASGIWQFIKSTGNRYGMRVNYWLDERRDPEKATRGAAAYLKELYEMFQSWPLALAAYNAGEGRVAQAIERQGTTDFWSLRLPRETQLYVPAFMAATIIAQNPDRYGFTAPVEEPWEVERVTVPGAVELRSVARVVGVSSDLIRDLNPGLMRGVTPVHASEYEILLPPDTKGILLANLNQLPRYSYREPTKTAAKQYRIRKGETLRSIASQHRIAVTALADLNGLRVGDRPKVGTRLWLPPATPSRKLASASVQAPQSRTAAVKVSKVAPANPVIHVVRRGDTLWGVAKAYAVTPEELRQWNDLGRRRVDLKPGQALQVAAQTAKSNREARRGTAASTTPTLHHRVKRGDTLWGIARIHDVTPEALRQWNDLGRQVKLQVGQELVIRPGKS